jgi:hypothetical protein
MDRMVLESVQSMESVQTRVVFVTGHDTEVVAQSAARNLKI